MSFWFFTKDRQGRGHVWSIHADPLFLLIVVALAASIVIRVPPTVGVTCIASMFAGWLLILAAKVELLRKGIWRSWGASQMSPRSTLLYQAGYAIIGVAFVCLIAAGLVF